MSSLSSTFFVQDVQQKVGAAKPHRQSAGRPHVEKVQTPLSKGW